MALGDFLDKLVNLKDRYLPARAIQWVAPACLALMICLLF